MGDWSRYALSDLVYVSPAAWARLYERFHAALWPAQAIALPAGLVLLALAARRRGWRAAMLIAALAWAGVGAVFQQRWHAELNWAAPLIGAAWLLQALLLALAATQRGDWAPAGWRQRCGLGAIALAVIAGPLLPRAEVFGLTPDATALATLGLLICGKPGRWGVVLWPLPLVALAMGLLMALQ
jgi:hypothetical protein